MQRVGKEQGNHSKMYVGYFSHFGSRKITLFSDTFPLPFSINLNGHSISDKQRIIKEFNFFFSNVGEDLANNFADNDPNIFKKFLTNKMGSSFSMEPPRVNEVFNLINSLSLYKSIELPYVTKHYIHA